MPRKFFNGGGLEKYGVEETNCALKGSKTVKKETVCTEFGRVNFPLFLLLFNFYRSSLHCLWTQIVKKKNQLILLLHMLLQSWIPHFIMKKNNIMCKANFCSMWQHLFSRVFIISYVQWYFMYKWIYILCITCCVPLYVSPVLTYHVLILLFL